LTHRSSQSAERSQGVRSQKPSLPQRWFGPHETPAEQGFGLQWWSAPHASASVQSSAAVQPATHSSVSQCPVGKQIIVSP
jgi:hypothetical protein